MLDHVHPLPVCGFRGHRPHAPACAPFARMAACGEIVDPEHPSYGMALCRHEDAPGVAVPFPVPKPPLPEPPPPATDDAPAIDGPFHGPSPVDDAPSPAPHEPAPEDDVPAPAPDGPAPTADEPSAAEDGPGPSIPTEDPPPREEEWTWPDLFDHLFRGLFLGLLAALLLALWKLFAGLGWAALAAWVWSLLEWLRGLPRPTLPDLPDGPDDPGEDEPDHEPFGPCSLRSADYPHWQWRERVEWVGGDVAIVGARWLRSASFSAGAAGCADCHYYEVLRGRYEVRPGGPGGFWRRVPYAIPFSHHTLDDVVWLDHNVGHRAFQAHDEDEYLPDRATGCEYRGAGEPLMSCRVGDSVRIDLRYVGVVGRGDPLDPDFALLHRADWGVFIEGTVRVRFVLVRLPPPFQDVPRLQLAEVYLEPLFDDD